MVVSPLAMFSRRTSSTSTQSTPSRCMPSGVGCPAVPGCASIRNWCTSTSHSATPGESVSNTRWQVPRMAVNAGNAATVSATGSNQRATPPFSAL